MMRASRATIAAVFTAAVVACAPSGARADETPAPPEHLAAYGLDWLNYIDPNDLPPSRYAVCIVDSGTLVTPDTPPDNPDGPILERLSTDGGPGTPQGDAFEQLHGTRMAMAAVAPENDWGTIGTTTWGRVVSVRAQVEGELGFRPDAYRKGIDLCKRVDPTYRIAVIGFSFGCNCDISASEESRLVDALGRARDNDISIVAAAGNVGGAPTEMPAAFPGIFAIAGGDSAGRLCTDSSFDDSVSVVGPACSVTGADPLTGQPLEDLNGGSSQATISGSVLLAALRTLRPDADAHQAEDWLRDSAQIVDGRRVLDGVRAAQLAGLGHVLRSAQARMPGQRTEDSQVPAPSGTDKSSSASAEPESLAGAFPTQMPRPAGKEAKFKTPEVRLSIPTNRRLVISAINRPRDAKVEAVIERLGEFGVSDRRLRRSSARSTIDFRPRWRVDRLRVRFIPKLASKRTLSDPRILRRSRSGRFR